MDGDMLYFVDEKSSSSDLVDVIQKKRLLSKITLRLWMYGNGGNGERSMWKLKL